MPASLALLALAATAGPAAAEEAPAKRPVLVLEVKGPIGPATSDYVHRSLEKARARHAAAVVLRIDTPGGLDTSMREIIRDILGSDIAIVGFVAPSGARAASAGTYILYATHVAAMAPATSLGAATPIVIGAPFPGGRPPEKEESREKPAEEKDDKAKEPKKPQPRGHPTLEDKMVNDAVAYIRGLAELRGRNAEWAAKAVTEAATLSAKEALANGVIDLMADDVRDLLEKADGRTVRILEEARTIGTRGREVVAVEPDWRSELLAVITNPNVAYILLLVGIYGLVFEFTHPGVVAPGVVGAICLVVALFALHVLPINYAGLGLILLGIAFMVAEAFVPAFGALGIGGIAAFVIGSVILLDTDVPGFGVSWPLIAATGGLSGGAFVVVLVLAVRARRRPVVSGQEEMVGSIGEALEWTDREGRVRVHGEIWRAAAAEAIAPGTRVKVTTMDGLTLTVRPVDQEGGIRDGD